MNNNSLRKSNDSIQSSNSGSGEGSDEGNDKFAELGLRETNVSYTTVEVEGSNE